MNSQLHYFLKKLSEIFGDIFVIKHLFVVDVFYKSSEPLLENRVLYQFKVQKFELWKL